MINFTSVIPTLAKDTMEMILKIGFNPHLYKINANNKIWHTIRISKNTEKFIKTIKIDKS